MGGPEVESGAGLQGQFDRCLQGFLFCTRKSRLNHPLDWADSRLGSSVWLVFLGGGATYTEPEDMGAEFKEEYWKAEL